MIILGTFKQSIELEQALAVLENKYVSREQIKVVFMDENLSTFQLASRSKNIHSNAFEVGLASATGSAVIGASIGFELTLGPILCGLISALIGFFIGYGLYYLFKKSKTKSRLEKQVPEVTVLIRCTKNESPLIKDILWKYQALTIGEVDDPQT